jgi:hypothetical protein
MLADVKGDHAVRRLPAHGVVQLARVAAAQVQLARGELIRSGHQPRHDLVAFEQDHGGRDMQQRGRNRADQEQFHGFLLHHI